MENAVTVEVNQCLENLVQQALNLLRGHGRALCFHVFLQVVLQVLEHEVEGLLGVENFFEPIEVINIS